MSGKRRRFGGGFKAGVALEALRGQRTINEIASTHGVHPHQVTAWKKQAQEGLPQVMEDGRTKEGRDAEALTDRLYQEIGQLKVELDWVKKTFVLSQR